MLRAILNKSWQQHPTRHQLYGHQPPMTKTIQTRRTRHAGHCWRSKDELVSDVLLWTPAYGQSNAGRLARTYIQQLCDDTGCNPEDLPEAMNDRETWEREGQGCPCWPHDMMMMMMSALRENLFDMVTLFCNQVIHNFTGSTHVFTIINIQSLKVVKYFSYLIKLSGPHCKRCRSRLCVILSFLNRPQNFFLRLTG